MEYVILTVLGLALGSFVNALVWRIHEQAKFYKEDGTKKNLSPNEAARFQALSISKGRSMCTHCGHELAAKDLVPVLSWVYLRGKCRYCTKPINDTPLAEILVPLLLIVSYSWWPYQISDQAPLGLVMFVIWTLIITCFVALIIYDAKWFLLPDRIVWPVTIMAVIFVVIAAIHTSSYYVILGGILGALTISGVFFAMATVSKGTWIGWGDVKLGITLGLLAGGPFMGLLVIFIASLLGTLVMLPTILRRGAGLKSSLPFGPHLILATLIVFLYGSTISSWYFALFNA